jgi:hypothetical protein
MLILCAGIGMSEAAAQEAEAPSVPALVTAPAPFVGITPCRIADTRDANLPAGYGPPSLAPGSPRSYTIAGQCGIPQGAVAVSLNVTVVSPQGFGYVLLYPQGGPQPGVSTLNYVAGQTVANAALVPLGTGGGITVAAAVHGTDFIIDTNGYYGGGITDPSNSFLGYNAGNHFTTGTTSTAIGFNALHGIGVGDGTAAGYQAMYFAQAAYENTAIGASALQQLSSNAQGLVAFGKGALSQNVSGMENTAVGAGALGATDANLNTAIGSGTLTAAPNSNAAVGYAAGSSLFNVGGNLDIASPGSSSDSHALRIGSVVQTRAFLAGIRGATLGPGPLAVVIDSAGQLGTPLSSARYKEDIVGASSASDRLLELRPVSFRYRIQEDDRPHYGLIAEEVERVFPELVACDPSGEVLTVLYDEIPVLILSELQKQERRLAEGRIRLDARREFLEREEAAIAAREREVAELERRLHALEKPVASTDGRP